MSTGAAMSSVAAGERPAFQPRPDPLYHAVHLALCGGVLVLAALLSIRNQSQVVVPLLGQPLPELCMARRLTGLSCPGCGLTRCFISIMHGDLAAAWQYNSAGLLLFGLMVAQIPFRSLQLWRSRRGLAELNTGWMAHALLGGFAVWMIGQWALRACGVPV